MRSDFKKIGRRVLTINASVCAFVCVCVYICVGVCMCDRKRPRLATHHRTVSWKNRLHRVCISAREKCATTGRDAEKLYYIKSGCNFERVCNIVLSEYAFSRNKANIFFLSQDNNIKYKVKFDPANVFWRHLFSINPILFNLTCSTIASRVFVFSLSSSISQRAHSQMQLWSTSLIKALSREP